MVASTKAPGPLHLRAQEQVGAMSLAREGVVEGAMVFLADPAILQVYIAAMAQLLGTVAFLTRTTSP